MKRPKFSSEFKEEALRLASQDGVKITEVARELGIRPELLYRWKSEYGGTSGDDNKKKVSPSEHDELIQLRRDLKRVTEERDILKKAMGVFTKELP